MSEKRFIGDGFEAIEDQSFTDNLTKKTYYVDYFDEIIDLLNELSAENEQLKEQIQTMKGGFDESVEILSEIKKDNEQLKNELDSFKPVIFNDYEHGKILQLYEKVDDGDGV